MTADLRSRPRRRADAHPSRPPARVWVDRSGTATAWLDPVDPDRPHQRVVHLGGELGTAAVQPCRAALDAALATHPDRVVLELDRIGGTTPFTVAFLSASRRYLGHRGASLVLADVPAAVWTALRRARVSALYET